MRLPKRDPYAPHDWAPHEKPALLGTPSTPEHPVPRRIAYGIVGLLVCLTGALGNAVVTANLHRNGYSSYLDVLDAQRTLFSTQLSVVQVKNNLLLAQIDLYRSLGGGWSSLSG